MKVFISWSGATSRSVAEVFHEWIPRVIQTVEPFLSAKDIHKGTRWAGELSTELNDTNFAIICLAPDNLNSPWLHYEAGAIAKTVDSRVCPILFHVKKDDVENPLAQMQLTDISRPDIEILMKTINASAGNPLSNESLMDTISVWWSHLEEKISKIPPPNTSPAKAPTPEPEQPPFDYQDMLGEIIDRLRRIESRTRNLSSGPRYAGAGNTPNKATRSNVTGLTRTIIAEALKYRFPIEKVESDPFAITFFSDIPIFEDLPLSLFIPASELSKQEKNNVIFQGIDGKFVVSEETYFRS